MPIVGAGFGDHVDHRAGVPALIGAVQIGLNFEFLDRFHARAQHDRERQPVVIIDAVIEEVVRAFTVSVGEDLGSGAPVVRPRAAHDGAADAISGTIHARRQSGQLHEIAAVQRQLLGKLRVDDCS